MNSAQTQLRDEYLIRAMDLMKLSNHESVQIKSMLDTMTDELSREINNIDPTAPKLSKYRIERTDKLIKQAKITIDKHYGYINKHHIATMSELASIESDYVRKIIIKILDADIANKLPAPSILKQLARRSLVQGTQSSEWWSRQSAKTAQAFSDQVKQGMIAGETLPQITQRIRGGTRGYLTLHGVPDVKGVTDSVTLQKGIVRTAKRNAEALIRTSVMQVSSSARRETYQANSDVIRGTQSISTLDGRTTPICIAYAGATHNLNGNPIPPTTLPYNPPPRHWGCRSVEVPLLKSLSEITGIPGLPSIPEGKRSSLTGYVPADISYNSWLKTQSKTTQDKLLGKKRAELWRTNKINVAELVKPASNQFLTLEQLRSKL